MNLRRATLPLILLALASFGSCKKKQAPPKEVDAQRLSLAKADLHEIADFVRAQRKGQRSEPPKILQQPGFGVYAAARSQGRRMSDAWGQGQSVGEALGRAIERMNQDLGEAAPVDTLELFLAVEIEEVDAKKQRARLHSNIRRGIYGLAIGEGPQRALYSPTYVIASNRKNQRLIELYLQEHGIPKDASDSLRYQFLLGPQLLISLQSEGPAQLMERGNRYVDLGEVNRASVSTFAQQMAVWMWNNLHADGRMTYLYWPSKGQEAGARDNLIRQFMATIALGRLAAKDESDALWQRAASNINFNLRRYYRLETDALGVVELRGKVKLGALALAALAIIEHRDRSQWAEEEAALRRSVMSLWREDGSFTTFLKPPGRNDNQNFYPGEALLMWATLYKENKDPALLEKFMKSFRYYRDWHLKPANRNPAFIPWHTQAYYLVWQETGDDELRDFIFKSNDWLLAVQQWEKVKYPDTRGRFHDPNRPFGPPHASSTGVYLEGLIDAYSLAKAVGDKERARAYQRSILRALRSSMQLQFVDDIDMFYVSNRSAVQGGLRTTVYDNQIRCDNVQHTLMGTLKILESDVLEPLPAKIE